MGKVLHSKESQVKLKLFIEAYVWNKGILHVEGPCTVLCIVFSRVVHSNFDEASLHLILCCGLPCKTLVSPTRCRGAMFAAWLCCHWRRRAVQRRCQLLSRCNLNLTPLKTLLSLFLLLFWYCQIQSQTCNIQ